MKLISTRHRAHVRVSALAFVCACAALAPQAHGDSWRRQGGGGSPPVISGTPASTVTAGTGYSFKPDVYDPDPGLLWYKIRGRPSWATFDYTLGVLSGTPTASDVGTYDNIRISVSDGRTGVSLPAFSIQVVAATDARGGVNSAPSITGSPSASVVAGQAYTFQPAASDADGDPLVFAAQNVPAWATFNNSTGRLSGTPTASAVGTYGNIVISVSDGVASIALAPFSIAVVAPSNAAPSINGAPGTSVVVGQAYAFQPSASDANGDTLTFAAQNVPAWATFSSATGRLWGTPSTGAIGTYSNVTISVSDGTASSTLAPFSIAVVAPPNSAPMISGAPATSVVAGQPYAFQPSASDPNGNQLTFAAQNVPAWATFSPSTGRLSGTPATTAVGTYGNIVISVSDGAASAALAPFSIAVVNASNSAPVISGSPATSVVAGQLYAFQASASDADGDALTFTAQNVPAWATFVGSAGRLYGTPPTTAVGTYASISISVSDGRASSSLAPFSIAVVNPPNAAPKISGIPTDTVVAGDAYAFRPMATDADGDALTFGIQNKPAWATFDMRTGALTGQPTASNVGNYTNIVISVSDGKTSAQLTPFTITVMQAVLGTVSLTWRAPTTNIDGSPITNLSGYKVFYGTSSQQYTQSLSLMSPALTTVMIEDLGSATWYFAVKAISNGGIESDYSSEVSKVIQ